MHLSTNRITALVVGGVWLVAGVAGFFVAPRIGFFSAPGKLLVGLFAVNPFASALDILLGAALVMVALSTTAAAKVATTIVGTAFLVLGLAGLFIIGTDANILALNGADNVVHFASAVLLLAVGLGAERSVKTAVTS